MIKLVAIDFDGTLLNSNHEISPENIKMINKVRQNGVKVVIVTGRPQILVMPFKKILGLNTPFILNNGGQINYLDERKIIFNRPLSKNKMLKVIELCNKLGSAYIIYGKRKIYYTPNKRIEIIKKMTLAYDESLRPKYEKIIDYKKIIMQNNFNKLLVIQYDTDKFNFIRKTISEIEGIKTYGFLKLGIIEVIPDDISKGAALAELAKYYKIKQSEVMAIGDQENDISMIRFAGLGVAMENASDDLKNSANAITLTNDMNGVAKALNKYVLNKELPTLK